MSDSNPLNTGDNLVSQLASSVLRHAFSGLAGILLAAGAIQSDQQSQFVTIGTSLAVWGAGLAWSWFEKIRAAKGK